MTVSVTARLGAEVAAQRLQFDVAQADAATHLDELARALRMQPPSMVQRLRSQLPWFAPAAAEGPRGVYLWGGVGRGKTLLMDLFFASLQSSSASGHGTPAPRSMRSHFYHFMRDVHAELGAMERQEEPLEIVARHLAARARVICLDEFLVADIADAMLLTGLFRGLFRRGVVLVTTSNVPPRGLYEGGLQRQRFLSAIDLIEAHVDVLHLDGGLDYRLRQLESASTYLDSTSADAASALERIFAAFAGGMATGPTTLAIEGRTVRVVNSAPGLAWFEFTELCDGPRSQNDYIEIARSYTTLVIGNVPRFDRSDDNAARRFIMLIDELYDRGVKIIVSAAAAPAALYHGERLRFESERAASRLMEMQTRQYLARQHRH